jgi:hypothetical protein
MRTLQYFPTFLKCSDGWRGPLFRSAKFLSAISRTSAAVCRRPPKTNHWRDASCLHMNASPFRRQGVIPNIFQSGDVLHLFCILARKLRQMACKPGSVSRCREDGHSSGMSVAAHLARPTRTAIRKTDHMPSLFGLAPGGACHAAFVAEDAVRSYRTISTLPRPIFARKTWPVGGVISVALSLGSPPADVIRHRVLRGARTFLSSSS